MQEGTRPRFELWSPKAPALMNTQCQPIFGFLPGIHLWRRGPPLRRGSPISCAQLAAVRRLIPSSLAMSLYKTPAKCRLQNICRIASDFMLKVLIVGKLQRLLLSKFPLQTSR